MDDVLGDFLEPPHGTTPAAVIENSITLWVLQLCVIVTEVYIHLMILFSNPQGLLAIIYVCVKDYCLSFFVSFILKCPSLKCFTHRAPIFISRKRLTYTDPLIEKNNNLGLRPSPTQTDM